MERVPEVPADKAEALDLGVILGRTQALGLIAGRCTAAQAVDACEMRSSTWRAARGGRSSVRSICTSGAPRPIGPCGCWTRTVSIYFEMSQLVRISPATFRSIAPYIKDAALHLNGQTIELSTENAKHVAAAVA